MGNRKRNIIAALCCTAVIAGGTYGAYTVCDASLAEAQEALAQSQADYGSAWASLVQAAQESPNLQASDDAETWLDSTAMPTVDETDDSILGKVYATEQAKLCRVRCDELTEQAEDLRYDIIREGRSEALAAARQRALPLHEDATALDAGDFGELTVRFEGTRALLGFMLDDELVWTAEQVDGVADNLRQVKAEVEQAWTRGQEEGRIAAESASGAIGRAEAGVDAPAQGGTAPKGATSTGRSQADGTWHVDYTDAYGTAQASQDGGVTQWADGYYIAHNWSENGAKISSETEYVEVDGTTYKLAGTREVSRDTCYEDIQGWANANNGIAMQTCVEGGGYRVNHYEPVG